LVVFDLEAERAETVASWEAGEPTPAVYSLPSHVSPQSPYPAIGSRKEPELQPFWERCLYLDSFTGQLAQPDPALGLHDGRQFLIDIVGDRALLIYVDSHVGAGLATGQLALFHGDQRTDLGAVSLSTHLHAAPVRFYTLSPDRRYFCWTGPEGTCIADLDSANAIERPGRYRWTGRTWGWGGFEAGERILDWLPDSSGRIEFWHDGDKRWHWEVFEPLGEAPVGSGEGRVTAFSPDVTHMLVYSEEADAHRGKPLPPDVPPYLLRPLPKRSTPGAPVPVDREGLDRGWAIDRDRVAYYAEALANETELAVCRITPEGFTRLPVRSSKPSYATVLAVADGGRLGVWTPIADRGEATVTAALPRYSTTTYDFAGKEKLRFAGHPQAADPGSGEFARVDGEGGDMRVTLTNALTGDRGAALHCSAEYVRVAQQGGHFVAYAFQDAGGSGAFDLFAAQADDTEWRAIARGVHALRPISWVSLYR